MTLMTKAVIFAADAHDAAVRKGSGIPYIVHPMEAASIAASITEDEEILAAAVLHDVMEDCGVSCEQIRKQFGDRVAGLVDRESQIVAGDRRASWGLRKMRAIEQIKGGGYESGIIALADKLSNMRAICRDYDRMGDALFAKFNQQDKRQYAWYYRGCCEALRPILGETSAWRELNVLIHYVFAGVVDREPECCRQARMQE